MKNLLTLIALVLTTSFTYAQTEKTVVKTFNLQGSTSVVLNLNGDVEVQEWSESTLRVHMSIKLENSNVHMLKYLLTQGRYNLKLDNTDAGVTMTSPGRNKDVIINKEGDKLSETVTYTVFVPQNVTTEIINKKTVEEAVSTGDK
ncbi:MAG: hypothetical protein AB8G11_01000 [Saprospiraceae bacterium]